MLYCDAVLNALDGKSARAVHSCGGCLNAARSVGDEPLIISQWIRASGVSLACRAAETTLHGPLPTPGELAELQRALENEEAFPRLPLALKGERACMHRMFEYLDSRPNSSQIGTATEQTDQLRELIWGSYQRAEHPRMLELYTRRIDDAARLPMHELAAAEHGESLELASLPPLQVAFTQLAFLSIDEASGLFRLTHAHLRTVIVAIALTRFRQAHKHWPEKLAELVPDQIAAIPEDPYTGRPLLYRHWTDGIGVYSVGPDRVDNGGVFNSNEHYRPGFDVGVHLTEEPLFPWPGAAEGSEP
jgi:hypothetical protein